MAEVREADATLALGGGDGTNLGNLKAADDSVPGIIRQVDPKKREIGSKAKRI